MDEKKTWRASLEHCFILDSTLATIHDDATNNFLFNLTLPFSAETSQEYWIGGIRTYPTGDNFAWVDQSNFHYAIYEPFWAPGQPTNGGNEYYLQVFKGLSGDGNIYDKPKWNDRADDAALTFICQYNL